MKNKDLASIGDVYGKMLNVFKHTHHLKEGNKNAFGEQPELVGKGPKADGYHEALNDEEEKEHDCDEEDEEEIHIENKKSAKKTLNKFMSKSVFDKLYNKVLKENFGQEDDTDALGLGDAAPDAEMDEFGGEEDLGEEDDSVTFTLPREVAQQLVDVLKGVLGGEEELGDEEGDLDFGDEGGDDLDFGAEEDEMDYQEDEEVQGTKVAPDKKKVYQQHNNKVTSKVVPHAKKAKSDVTDEVGTKDGAPPITALQGKSNQVPGSTLKKASDFFK